MLCPNCQTENPANSRYCRKCGQKMKAVPPDQCPQCGNQNPPGSQFCNKCGTALAGASAPRAPQQPKAPSPKPQGLTYNQKVGLGLAGLLIFIVALGIVFIPQWRNEPTPMDTPTAQTQQNMGQTSSQGSSGMMGQQEPYVEGDPTQNAELQATLQKIQTELENDPQNLKYQADIGNLYYDYGFFKHAIEAYEKVLAVDSTRVNVMVDCATCYYYTQEPEVAIQMYEKALELDPSHINANYNLAIVLNSTGHHEAAVKQFQIALDLEPDGALAERARQFIQRYNQMKNQQM